MADFKAQVIHLHLRRCWLNLSSSQMGSSKMFSRVKENIISRKTQRNCSCKHYIKSNSSR